MGYIRLLPISYTCLFAFNNQIAYHAVNALRAYGYRVPEDISVVGFDNYIYPGLCDVEITTYEVDMKEMARISVNKVIKRMSGEYLKQKISIVDGHMVCKESVCRHV